MTVLEMLLETVSVAVFSDTEACPVKETDGEKVPTVLDVVNVRLTVS